MSIIRGRERLRALFSDNQTCTLARKVETIIVEEFYRTRHRTSPGTRAVHRMPTPSQVLRLRTLKRRNRRANDGDLGRKCGIVNHGRVSEILYGTDGRAVYNRKGERIA